VPSLVVSEGATGLLASYDLFFVSGQKTTTLFLFTFSLYDLKGTRPPREGSLLFSKDVNFVFVDVLSCHKVPSESCS
jgi:hypothetical protein